MQDRAQILTITSLKGGTAKTTLTGLLALYLAQRCGRTVMLVDLDPQAGTTALFLDGKAQGPTVFDLLQESASGALDPIFCREAFRSTLYTSAVFVLPGDARLGLLAPEELPLEMLRVALETAAFGTESVVLIDTGTARLLVALGIAAADGVLVPMLLSPQSIKPTVNTLVMLQRQEKPLAGLVPVGVGNAQWEVELLAGWKRTLATRFSSLRLLSEEQPILPALPPARQLVRGQWVGGPFPERFSPTCAALTQVLFPRESQNEEPHAAA